MKKRPTCSGCGSVVHSVPGRLGMVCQSCGTITEMFGRLEVTRCL